MRKVSEELIKKINNYVLVQKVSIEAVFVLINSDIKIYPHEVQQHLKKYVKYLIWLDDNSKDTKNSWEKYVNRVEWLGNKESSENNKVETENRMHQIVKDLEEQEAIMKKKRENSKRLESISKEMWKDHIDERSDVQLAFEEVLLSNGETIMATLIEEQLENISSTEEELQHTLFIDDGLNTILTEDLEEETYLENTINEVQETLQEVFTLDNILNEKGDLTLNDFSSLENDKNLKSEEILTADLINKLENEDLEQELSLGSEFGKTFQALPKIHDEDNESSISEEEWNYSSEKNLNELNDKLENIDTDIFKLSEEDIKTDAIVTSDYFMFEDLNTKKNEIEKFVDDEVIAQEATLDGNTIMIEVESTEKSNEIDEELIEFNDDTFMTSNLESTIEEESISYVQEAKTSSSKTDIENTIMEKESLVQTSSLVKQNDDKSISKEVESLIDDFNDESYLTIKRFEEENVFNDFVLDDEEKTLFEITQEDESTIDQSMFEDSTLQTFAEDQNSTVGALDFLSNLEEKYATLLEVDSELTNNGHYETDEIETKATNTLEALDFLIKMDSKYSDILNDDNDETISDIEEELIDIIEEI